MSGGNLINSILCCLNPIFPISCNHYVCGSDLALFTSIAQVENCLTGFTNTCKSLTQGGNNCCKRNSKDVK